MLAADEFPAVEVHRRRPRRRSARSRVVRKVKHGWRKTKLRKAIFSLILAAAAVLGGYKVSMYVIDHAATPSLDEFNTNGK
jgi:hypothetical protein